MTAVDMDTVVTVLIVHRGKARVAGSMVVDSQEPQLLVCLKAVDREATALDQVICLAISQSWLTDLLIDLKERIQGLMIPMVAILEHLLINLVLMDIAGVDMALPMAFLEVLHTRPHRPMGSNRTEAWLVDNSNQEMQSILLLHLDISQGECFIIIFISY